MLPSSNANLTAATWGWLRDHTNGLTPPITFDSTIILLSSLVAATAVLLFYTRISNSPPGDTTAKAPPPPNTVDVNKDRNNGEWSPVEFTYPEFQACPLELAEIKPIPYRPFRWGDYYVTMGIRNMPWEEWIELDNQFPTYHRIRSHRLRTRGSQVLRVLPANPGVVGSGHKAAIELVHELAEYLSRRYPSTFRIVRHVYECETPTCGYGWSGAPPIKHITIVPLGVTYDLPLDADPADGVAGDDAAAYRALEIAALLVQDDLALMVEGSDGRYYFQAGAICVAGFWRMQDKLGLPLDEIHLTGNVPQYQEKLHTSLERFFKRLAVDKPVIRNNYFVQVIKAPRVGSTRAERTEDGNEGDEGMEDIDPEELAWSATTNGPEDTYMHGRHAHPDERPIPTAETLRLRTERQTLRRLPRSGAIVFTIRTYVVGVEALGREKGIPGRMASAVRSWPADVRIYKGQALYRDVLLEYLDQCHEGQVARGEVGEMERTSVYPY